MIDEYEHPIRIFSKLHTQAVDVIGQQKNLLQRHMLHPYSVFILHSIIVTIFIVYTIFTSIAPDIEASFSFFDKFLYSPKVNSMFIGMIIVVILSYITRWINQNPQKWWRLIYGIFIQPGIWIFLALISTNESFKWMYLLELIFLSVGLYIFIYIFIYFILSGIIPTTYIFLILTSLRSTTDRVVVPTYELLLEQIVSKVMSDIRDLSTEQRSDITLIIQTKLNGINGRLQTLALFLGSMALFGLATLVVAQDAITATLNQVLSAMGDSTPPAHFGTGLVIVGLLIFIATFAFYALHSYREIRILEALTIACGLHTNSTPGHQQRDTDQPVTVNAEDGDRRGIAFVIGIVALAGIIVRWIAPDPPST